MEIVQRNSMRRKNLTAETETETEKQKLFPIVPIHIPYSPFFVPSIETDSTDESISSSITTSSTSTTNKGSVNTTKALVSSILQSLESDRATNANLPEQTEEILEQLRNPGTKFEIRRMKKTSYSYRSIPQKVRESISTKRPTSLGTACGIGQYGIMRIYILEENYESASKWGFQNGDIILDARTRTMSPFIANKNKPIAEDVIEGAMGFILPVESHCVEESMLQSLSDFIQISLLPLSVAVPRYVLSNRAGGLEAHPKWRGVVVSSEIGEALEAPSGWIYRELEEKWGVQLAVEWAAFCPEAVEKLGMKLVSRISW